MSQPLPLVVSLLSLILISFPLSAAPPTAGELMALYEPHVYTDASGGHLLYRLARPPKYDPKGSYPLILFLHGAGGRGDDNRAQLLDAAGFSAVKFAMPRYQGHYPCFIVAPQCPPDQAWVDVDWRSLNITLPRRQSDPLRMTMQLIDVLRSQLPIDGRRIYVTGLSMGGFGVWDLAIRHPNFFAAAVPVCGGGDVSLAPRLVKMPIWCFHGSVDPIVSVAHSRRMIRAIRKAGGRPRYSEFRGVGHNAWYRAYNEPDLLPWLFSQRLALPPRL